MESESNNISSSVAIEAFKIIVLVLIQNAIVELAGWYYIFQTEEYKDLNERTRNLGKKLE